MRFPRPRSSIKLIPSASASMSGPMSVVGSVKNTLKATLSKTKSGKYSQNMLKRRFGGSSAAKPAAVAEKDLPKLADLAKEMQVVEEGRDDAEACSIGPAKMDMTSGRDAADANVKARDGPPEDNDEEDDDEAEPIVTATAAEVAVAANQHLATPKSPIIFGFRTVPSTSPAPGNLNVEEGTVAPPSNDCELTTKLSMRSTVLVEDASISAAEDNDAADDEDGEGEDEYESDYDGSLADESAEHAVTSARNKTASSRNDAKKKHRSKVDEKRLRDGHRRACKYLKNGDFSYALEEFEGILDELMKSLGDSHRRVGSALHNVGIVNIRADNLSDAIDALEEAIRIRKDVHGPNHPKVADSLLELGIAFLSQKYFEDALKIFSQALEIRENDLAEEARRCLAEEARHGSNEERIHCALQVAKALNNIACVYFEYGELSKALEVMEDVLEMQQAAIDELTEGDPNYKQAKLSLATTFCNIGFVHADSADWDNAIEFLDRSYAIQAEHLPLGSGIAISTLENLAYANYKEKNLGIALEMYQEIWLDQVELYGRYNLACAETLQNIACIHVKQCEYDQALNELSMAEEIQLDVLGGRSRRLKRTRAMISEIQYEFLKFPSIPEMVNRAILCSFGHGEVSELASHGNFQPIKPDITFQMSGHKISYA